MGTLTGIAQHVQVHCWIIQWDLHVPMCWDHKAGKVLSEICLGFCIKLRMCFPSPLRPSSLLPTHFRSPVQAFCFSPWLFHPILSLQPLREQLSPFSADEKLPRAGVNLSPPRGSHHPSKPHHKHRLQTDNKQIKHTTPTATACKSYLQSCKGKITPFICLPREPPVCSGDNPYLSKLHPKNLNFKTQFD